MKRIRLLAISALFVSVSACNLGPVVQGLADAPTQIVMVHVVSQPAAWPGVTTKVFPLPPDGGQLGFVVQPSGGLLTAQHASRSIPPGIAANNDLYVVAYWGGSNPAVNVLHIFVSENGRRWSYAGGTTLLTPSQDPGLMGRPAVTFFPRTGTWFVAFRDPANGAIRVEQFRIACVVVGGQCSQDAGGVPVYAATRLAAAPGPGVSSSFAPALSYLDRELILGYVGAGVVVTILKSGDGIAWTPSPGVPATVGGVSLRTLDSPYLSNSLGELSLATTADRGSGRDAILFGSTDGISWTETKRHITGAGFSRYEPATAGNTSDRIYAFPGANYTNVEFAFGPSTRTNVLMVGRNYGVSLAKGPGPIAVDRQPCARGQNLIARTASGDVPGPNQPGFGVNPVTFSTNGSFEVICSPPSTTRRVCPSNTIYATIRGPGPTFVIECWRRYPDSQ